MPRGGGGGGRRGGGAGGGAGPASAPDVWEEVKHVLLNNLYWVVPVFLVLLALVVVVMWVRARGKFMFLEGVAYDRAAVVEPWKRLRPPANSYFRFELLLTLLMLLVIAGVAVLAYVLALPDIEARRFGGAAITAIIVGGSLLLLGSLAFALIQAVAEDFLIPLMYLRGGTVGSAWAEFRRSILSGNLGVIALFYLMRIVLGIATAIALTFLVCCTFCIAAIPYLGTVLALPIFVFHRSYSLYFLRQFGNEYNLLMEPPPPSGFPMGFPVIMASPQPESGGQQPGAGPH
jgi:hypothetical protein